MKKNAPDFLKCNKIANEILLKSNLIQGFPFPVKKVVHEQNQNVMCRSFRKANEYGLNVKAFGSNSAVIQKMNNRYIIFYNELEYKPRVNFDILHEDNHLNCGHKFYSHEELLHLSPNDKELYNIQEVEANFTSALMFMPDVIIKEFIKRGRIISIDFLKETFGVSNEAAEKKKTFLSGDYYKNYKMNHEEYFENQILQKFMPWIDLKCPKIYWMDYEDEVERQQERDNWI